MKMEFDVQTMKHMPIFFFFFFFWTEKESPVFCQGGLRPLFCTRPRVIAFPYCKIFCTCALD